MSVLPILMDGTVNTDSLSKESQKKGEIAEELKPTNVLLLSKQRNKMDFRIQKQVD